MRRQLVEGNLPRALNDNPRPGQKRKLTARQEARLIAEACTPPPAGRARWTLRLLAGRMVELNLVDSLSHESVRRVLKKNDLRPWQKREWCIPEVNAEFVAAMEEVLELYEQPADPQHPRVYFDETPKQLIAETRQPLPARPGQPERYGYECRRNPLLLVEPAGRRRPALGCHTQSLGVENGLHWCLDIAFREDESRIRKGAGDQNFAVLRHMALNLLKQERTAKIGLKAKRLKAGWDEPTRSRFWPDKMRLPLGIATVAAGADMPFYNAVPSCARSPLPPDNDYLIYHNLTIDYSVLLYFLSSHCQLKDLY